MAKISTINLKKAAERIAKEVKARQEKYEERSLTWQEGAKGNAYLDKTNELEDLHKDLEDVIEGLDEWNGEDRL